MTDENEIDQAGEGEFAIGFGGGMESDETRKGVETALSEVQSSLQEVRGIIVESVRSCIQECTGPASECQACIAGSISNHLSDVNKSIRSAQEAIASRTANFVNTARGKIIEAQGDLPPEMSAPPNPGGPGTLGGCPPGFHLGIPFPGSPTVCIPDTTPPIIPPSPPSPPAPTPPSGPDNPPDEPPDEPPPPECLSSYSAGPDVCTLDKCQSSCELAGGVFAFNEGMQTWLCTLPDGSVSGCVSPENVACFSSPGECALFVAKMSEVGWVLQQSDPLNQWTIEAYNTNTGETISCGGQCNEWPNRKGPCGKPVEAPLESWLAMRDDLQAQWMDRYGNVYGPVCDLTDCPIPAESTYYYYYGFGAIWVEFSDGKKGWFTGGTVAICVDEEIVEVEPTLADATEWIAQQENPDDWELVYNNDTDQYDFYNSETEEQFSAEDQEPADPPPVPPTPDPEGYGLKLDYTLPVSEFLFAGRL